MASSWRVMEVCRELFMVAAGVASIIAVLGISGVRPHEQRRVFAANVLAANSTVPALFIMGDSTVDVGNNNMLLTLAQATFPPYGQDFDTHQPTGRFCNGRLSVDYLATYLGLPLVPSYMSMDATIDITKGVNFASAGSGILNDTGTIFFDRSRREYARYDVTTADIYKGEYISLSQQLEQFRDVTQRLKTALGDATASSIISDALYYISTGSNDYINNYLLPGNPYVQLLSEEYEQLLVSNFTEHIKAMFRMGARKIAISSVSPLGCIPSLLFKMGSKQGECIGQVNELVVQYNHLLRESLGSLRRHLPGVKLVYNDAYTVFLEIAANATSYGMKSIHESCCGAGPYGGLKTCSRGFQTCADPRAYFFWDEYHPTSTVYHLIARRFWSGSVGVSFPCNLRTLAFDKGSCDGLTNSTSDCCHGSVNNP